MLERLSWKRLALELFLACIPALILGAFVGHLPWFLLAAVTGLLIWHFWNLMRLSWWLWVDRSMTPPPGRGSWEPLLYGLHQMQMRNKKRRRELGSLIKRFRSGAESLPDAVVLTTEEGAIFWCNGLAQQILNLRWPDDSGQNILNLLRYPEFANYLKQRDFSKPLNLVLNNARHLEIRVMPYSDKQWLMVARDVTQMHQLEGARRNFFANVSHELRTPLAVLRGELEAIQDGVRRFTPESIPSLQAEVATLTKLVDDLHQLSMSDEGALAYQKTSLDIITLLEVAAGAFRERFASRQLSIQVSLPEQAMIFGDRDRLMQLFNNLLENSLRYTDSGGSLHITARRSGRMLVIDFADSAPGVSDEQLARLCERFYRAEGSRNRASGGSGLGLAICLNIVAAHGGTLRADHSPFGGVSIKVELPLEHDLPRDV